MTKVYAFHFRVDKQCRTTRQSRRRSSCCCWGREKAEKARYSGRWSSFTGWFPKKTESTLWAFVSLLFFPAALKYWLEWASSNQLFTMVFVRWGLVVHVCMSFRAWLTHRQGITRSWEVFGFFVQKQREIGKILSTDFALSSCLNAEYTTHLALATRKCLSPSCRDNAMPLTPKGCRKSKSRQLLSEDH